LAYLITCEHAGNKVPKPYRKLFSGKEDFLSTHRGYDIKALEVASFLSAALSAQLYYSPISRLLVDVNRSRHNRALFSEFTKGLERAEKEKILKRYYRPHRLAVESEIARQIEAGHRVVHLGVHSFTPELHGKVRTADIGLLYDPAREGEKVLCRQWRQTIRRLSERLVVRRNYPYLGKTDGLITYMRKHFPAEDYIGIELEINQRLFTGPRQLHRAMLQTLRDALLISAGTLEL